MYQHELARSGKFLFVIRGTYIYAVIAIATLIAWCTRDAGPFDSASADCAWFWLSLGVATLGAVIRIFTSGWAALGTSGRVKAAAEAAELNTTGPYSLVRNPLYVGRIVNYTGMAMLSGSWVFGAITFLLSVLIYERVSIYEEEFLRGKFGDAHAKWAKDVPALFPRFHGWVKPKYKFWWKRMIWRERQKVFLLGTCVFLCWFARLGFDAAAVPAGQAWVFWAWGGLAAAFLLTEIGSWTGYYRDMR
ncbi:methyltransferase family protein [Sphingomonas canadensis]|uniref:Methyltransferase family protein n=1 Tax=Sphingomonas canadensis TaxID=1219257 RepID=A0ABW3H5Q1_9SPHN|nr:isoprenylcysteine carboxylmethyltransferase family protein [Sphingomonas canadensis]MCW3835129.1 isoprenylcysteine carboxylmethyltransferase family protein [Sphingomonas canadensis]